MSGAFVGQKKGVFSKKSVVLFFCVRLKLKSMCVYIYNSLQNVA